MAAMRHGTLGGLDQHGKDGLLQREAQIRRRVRVGRVGIWHVGGAWLLGRPLPLLGR